MPKAEKPLVWLAGEIKSPPFTVEGRIEAGTLLHRLQQGESLGPPSSKPMPIIGQACHELRIPDAGKNWRIFYHLDADCIVILDIHHKTTQKTPQHVLDLCSRRLKRYHTCS
jgi:phage-related protein